MLTVSAIKADVGSIGGHTCPSTKMLEGANDQLSKATAQGLINDYKITYTGDDICLLMIHARGKENPEIHDLSWNVFKEATSIAHAEGLYGAGQDLLKDAPSGNVRGAGPGSAEISYDPEAEERPVESFLVFTADKCGPGAFNFPVWAAFTSPLYCAGLLMPKMKAGFKFTVIDMENAQGDRVIELDTPEHHIDLAVLLRDENRFGIQSIFARQFPEQQVVAISTDRLHTIAGQYTGKDDPVGIVRTQGIFPAPEEIVSPYTVGYYVAGDARGSHHMPIMPAPINTTVTGPYCLPLISCMAYSVTREGKFSEGVDMFGNPAWDATRHKVQQKADEMRRQGFIGAAMLPTSELEYGSMRKSVAELEEKFTVR